MSGLFSTPKTVAAPRVPPPVAVPQAQDESSVAEMLKAGRRSGFQKTILTGALEPQTTGKKTLLGGP